MELRSYSPPATATHRHANPTNVKMFSLPPQRGRGGPRGGGRGWRSDRGRPPFGGTRPTLPSRQPASPTSADPWRTGPSYAGVAGVVQPKTTITQEEKQAYSDLIKKSETSSQFLQFECKKLNPQSKKLEKSDWARIIFDDFQLKSGDIQAIFFSDNNEKVQLKMGGEINTLNMTMKPMIKLEEREITMTGPQRSQNIVRFRNVAPEIPDLELVHLVRCFGGTLEEGAQVVHETTPITNPVTGEELQLKSDTRSLRANFPTNRRPYSFFWLAGVARDDRLHRVVVECPAQGNSRQCSNCLRWSAHPTNPCGFSAKAGACRRSGARCTLSTYFRKLQIEEGYSSVRDLHKFEDHKNSLSSDFFYRK